MEKTYGVLIDTMSIQSYIFGSNRLRENLGASFLVENIYETQKPTDAQEKQPFLPLRQAVGTTFSDMPEEKIDTCLNHWKEAPGTLLTQMGQPCEIGYIGGGNALLLFREETKAKEFIKEWSTLLLLHAPGVMPAFACDEIDLEQGGPFKNSQRTLFRQLKENKTQSVPQTVLPRHGITAKCSRSGFSQDIFYDRKKDEKGHISAATFAKLAAVDDGFARRRVDRLLHELKPSKTYCFVDSLDDLLQNQTEDSHIAIAHIDGNEMGKRFQNLTSLEEKRLLAIHLQNATEEAFQKLIGQIVQDMEAGHIATNCDDSQRAILPLRPIIIGGDDITFVSDGRLGIYCAKIFMEHFEKACLEHKICGEDNRITTCAGIAVTRLKFPFYRGYEMAEELCSNAKRRKKEQETDPAHNGSWLDFHITYGGFSGSLKDIRKTQYRYYWKPDKILHREMLFRPYLLGKAHEEFSFETLVNNTKTLKTFPNLKIKELRTVLSQGKEATAFFIKEQEYRDRKLPRFQKKTYHDDGFQNEDTPYFDMIEFMELYPEFALKEERS